MTAPRSRVLFVACIFGLIACGLVYTALRRAPGRGSAEVTKTVLVAKLDIEPRTEVTIDMLAARKIPVEALRPDAIAMPRDAVGKVATIKILAGEPILASKLAPKGADLGMAFVVPPTMRAVTVANDQVIGVAGFVKGGDRVDVIATFPPGEGHGTVTKTVLQDVMVLATGGRMKDEKEVSGNVSKSTPNPTVTLLVTPEQAEKLVLAELRGKIRLALRSAGDLAQMPVHGASLASVAGVSDAPRSSSAPAAPRPAPRPTPYYNPIVPRPAPALPTPVSLSLLPPKQLKVSSEESPAKPIIEVIRGTQKEMVTTAGR